MDRGQHLSCPLCLQADYKLFHQDNKRRYYRCQHCALVFIPPDQRLPREQEKTIYDLHENNPADAGYRRFLSRLMIPLCERIEKTAYGLDFGCGPGPALAEMLQQAGHQVNLYDPFYADNPGVLRQCYNFITCTEVVEHLFHPQREFALLFSLLQADGWLGIMTKQVSSPQAFSDWHYKNDLTHVCFYSRLTFQWLAEKFDCGLEFIGNDVILLQKKSRGGVNNRKQTT